MFTEISVEEEELAEVLCDSQNQWTRECQGKIRLKKLKSAYKNRA